MFQVFYSTNYEESFAFAQTVNYKQEYENLNETATIIRSKIIHEKVFFFFFLLKAVKAYSKKIDVTKNSDLSIHACDWLECFEYTNQKTRYTTLSASHFVVTLIWEKAYHIII